MAIILWLCYGYTIFTMVMNYGYYNHEEIHLILNHRNLEIFVLYRWSNLNLQMASGWKKRWNHPFRDCRNLISPRHLDLSILNNTILEVPMQHEHPHERKISLFFLVVKR